MIVMDGKRRRTAATVLGLVAFFSAFGPSQRPKSDARKMWLKSFWSIPFCARWPPFSFLPVGANQNPQISPVSRIFEWNPKWRSEPFWILACITRVCTIVLFDDFGTKSSFWQRIKKKGIPASINESDSFVRNSIISKQRVHNIDCKQKETIYKLQSKYEVVAHSGLVFETFLCRSVDAIVIFCRRQWDRKLNSESPLWRHQCRHLDRRPFLGKLEMRLATW